MDDSHVRRNHFEVPEGRLSPAQEGVALLVAFEFQLRVDGECSDRGELIYLHRVVDHQLSRLQRIDERRVAAHFFHGIAHGAQVHHRRNTGKVLHQHACRRERDLLVRDRLRFPSRQKAHVVRGHAAAVFRAQEIFQKDFQRKRKALRGAIMLFQSVQPVNFIFLVAGAQL